QDVPALAAEVAGWQEALWTTVRVGSYVRPVGTGYAESTTRQLPVGPPAAVSVPLRLAVKPAPGQAEVVLYLEARELAGGGERVVWHRPRFEGSGKPALLLRDYARFGPAFEADYPSAFAGTAKYLAAAAEAARDPKWTPDDLAKKHGLDSPFLRRWVEVLAVGPPRTAEGSKTVPAVPLQ